MDAELPGGLSHYYKEDRPWGNFERFTSNEASTVKIITVKPGEAFSLQTHEHRDEFWRILQGSGMVTVGEARMQGMPGDHFFVPRGTKHRVEAGADGVKFLEVAFGTFDEADIIRLEDKYGRT